MRETGPTHTHGDQTRPTPHNIIALALRCLTAASQSAWCCATHTHIFDQEQRSVSGLATTTVATICRGEARYRVQACALQPERGSTAESPSVGASTMIASQKSRGISGTGVLGIRFLVTYTLVALAWGLAACPHPAMATPTTSGNLAYSPLEEARAPPSRPPWDPQGCQTIVFFHVPKTGGMSVLATLGLQWWRDGYSSTSMRRTGVSVNTQANNLMMMKPWSHESRKLRHKFVEIHCGNAISFMQARETLKAMRTEHEENDCGFFAFTVIRSPLEWLISRYNYTCSKYNNPTCPEQVLPEKMPPKEQMLALPLRNGQVSYLNDGKCGWASGGPVNESTVDEVFSSLTSHLDHVALTDEVSELRKYLTKRFAAPDSVLTSEAEDHLDWGETQNANNAKVVQLSDFNPEELEQLNSTVQLDWKLYERVKADHKPVSVGDIVSTPTGDRKS